MNSDHNRTATFLGGLAAGIALMYITDPDGGPRRRALARDKANHLLHLGRDFLNKAGRDLGHRAQGLLAETRDALLQPDTTDDLLVERVRSRMGHYVSHPRAINVTSDQGRIVLKGSILAPETSKLMKVVPKVRGVREVENRLVEHPEADVPELQGEDPDAHEFRGRWTPGLQLLTGLAIGVGLLVGARVARRPRTRRDASLDGRADMRTEVAGTAGGWPR